MFLSTLAASDFLHTGFKRVRVLFSMMQKWVMSFRIVPWTPSFACSTGGKSSGELPQVAPLLYREAFIVAWQNSPGCHSPNLDKNTQLRLVLSFLLFLIPQFSPRKGSSYVFSIPCGVLLSFPLYVEICFICKQWHCEPAASHACLTGLFLSSKELKVPEGYL